MTRPYSGAPQPRRPWRTIVAAMRDPARSEFAFVPHQYIYAPLELSDDSLSPSETTPINARKDWEERPAKLHSNRFFVLHVIAIGLSGFCCTWLALFPISPNRLYNMQVDVFNTNHDHTNFFFKPCLYLGHVLGAAVAGVLGERLGRAGSLELAAIPYIIGWLLVGVAYGEVTVLIGRYLLGAATGMMMVIAPVYLAEVSATAVRGRVLCVQALIAGLGRLCYLGVGALFIYLSRSYLGFNLSEWKVLAMSGLVPGFALLLTMQCLPDSPTWLVRRHSDHEAAFGILVKLFGGDSKSAENQVNAIIHADALAKQSRGPHRGAFFRPLLLCCALFGLRAIATSLLEPTLSPTTARSFQVTLLGVGLDVGEVELLYVMTFMWAASSVGVVTCFLLIDLRGRLVALRAGCCVVAGCMCLLPASAYKAQTMSFHATDCSSAAMLLVIAGHNLGLGVVPVVVASELFPARLRMSAMSVVVICEALVKCGLSYGMPRLRDHLSFVQLFALSALIVMLCNLLAVLLSWFSMPETSRRSLQEIEAILSGWLPATPQLGFSRGNVRVGYAGNAPTMPRLKYGT
ncbi:TPA: hypothetical protein N0F65_007011 [Lagenidium giganteum]|uniref:Hexose transporter 1 n=1 Tax=Lagenidium giganteum TaxID=4803 RepID=A0AAV2ZKJ1_9STRA|nr:TPA: hypothetical protein N0F65_007011 [Lagenidium giganteum]